MQRIMVFDRLDAYRFDLDPEQTCELRSVEEVNGEHSLTVTTRQRLEKTDRILAKDGMGHWHEWVVTGIDQTHDWTTFYCVWSLQYDLSQTFVDNMYGCGVVPGHASVPHPVTDGLTIALSSTTRWDIGTVTVTTQASASFYRMSGWEGLQRILERWGGELSATIDVGLSGVTGRHVDLLQHVGSSTPSRRFDYGGDVAGIKRTVADEVWPCRIVPLGASQETEAGGYTRRPDISSVNGGVMWLQNDAMVDLVKVPDGQGGWEYPTAIVRNDTYEEPADVKAWALDNLTELTTPRVSYSVDVVQTTQAGKGPLGVALGDEVVVVDRDFLQEGLRISARVVKVEENLLDRSDIKLTIGNAMETLSGQFGDLSRQVEALGEQVSNASSFQSSAAYVSALIGRLNDEANATGGYTYITEGQGTRTYDVAVSDPLVGAEASKVVEIKGGTIRIADTKDGQGNWQWKTLITSGVVNSELIRAITDGSGWITQMTSSGMEVLDGLVSRAYFGATARIGATGESHVLVDHHSLQLVDKDGMVYFLVNDLRDQDGYYETTETFDGNGTNTLFVVKYPISTITQVTVGGTATTAYSMSLVYTDRGIVLNSAPASGVQVAITYKTDSYELKAYTVGTRASGSESGAYSVAEGFVTIASGDYSHAEGYASTASGERSHAEGMGVASGETSHAEGSGTASGVYAHAEGRNTEASGYGSHAQNDGTKATANDQTALGRYNAALGANYALIIGNGTDDNNRSNALAVQWDGTVETATPLPIASGGTGTTAFGTVVSKDVSTAVSVASGTNTSLGSVTLTEGTWILRYAARFDTNATGRRVAVIGISDGSITSTWQRYCGSETMAVADGATILNGSLIRVVTATGDKTFYLTVYQNSGGSLNVTGNLQAIRIK